MFAMRLCATIGLTTCLAGCAADDGQFTLPTGDAERGQEAFVKFRCFDCHLVHSVNLPPGEEPGQVMVELGGQVDRLRDYGDLVTAIINPSHRLAMGYSENMVANDGKSRMTVYNDVMTVSQLIDIVTFLQSHYELRPYEPTPYPDYYGP
jgi:L-cysteine S-thiosulfotransferase